MATSSVSPTSSLLPSSTTLLALLAILAATTAAVPSRADDTIKHPGDHPAYNVEVEPHLILGWGDVYGAGGYGLGVRFSIPIIDNGFVNTINNSVAITFGGDIVHYDNCWYNGACSANYFDIPVAMQWNFYVAQRFSAFGEPGVVLYHGFVPDCPPNSECPNPSPGHVGLGVEPALFLGARYYLNDKVTLTARIGFPAFTFGVSFLP